MSEKKKKENVSILLLKSMIKKRKDNNNLWKKRIENNEIKDTSLIDYVVSVNSLELRQLNVIYRYIRKLEKEVQNKNDRVATSN